MEIMVAGQPALEEWNTQVVRLGEALIGAVSPNFRMVVLQWAGGEWVLRFYLQDEDPEDMEEVDDIVFHFDAFQDRILKIGWETTIGDGPLPKVIYPDRIVYRRRESC